MKIIALSNQKGGCAKTTTAQLLSAGLSRQGRKVVAIDTDPQGNFSFGYGLADPEEGYSLYDVYRKRSDISDCIVPIRIGLDAIQGGIMLAGADMEFNQTGREYMLKEAVESLRGRYDYCIIDTPPSLGVLTMNALTVADEVIVPISCDAYSMQGLGQLVSFIANIRKYYNRNLHIEGLLLTRYVASQLTSKAVRSSLQPVATQLQTKIFRTMIRQSTAIGKSQLAQSVDLFESMPKEDVTNDYNDLIAEVIADMEG